MINSIPKYLPDYYENDTFEEVSIEVYSVDPNSKVPLDLTGSDIVMNMVQNGVVYKVYQTSDSSLSIDTNKIIIPEGPITLSAGTYDFDFFITLANGNTMPGFGKGTLTILQSITKKP
jgi:hypothetical protein